MQLKQIINAMGPVAYWTGEVYGATDVYDDYGNFNLVNENALLGQSGSLNENLSSKSINLSGGYLRVLEGTFMNDQINNMEFMISFGFRIPNRTVSNKIAGFKPIVSKWSPEQQFAIGFENGSMTANVMTLAGLVTVTFPYDQVVYNDQWNHCIFRVTSSSLVLYVNGISVSVSNSSPITQSSTSLFQIGGSGSETFSNDVLVADIAVTTLDTAQFDNAALTMTRTKLERWKLYNPTHLYDFTDVTAPGTPIKNHGSSDANGYIVNAQSVVNGAHDSLYVGNYCRLPVDSWFTIDDVITWSSPEGKSLMIDGAFDVGSMNSATTLQKRFAIMDLRTSMDNNNSRIKLSANKYSTEYPLGMDTWDSTGSQVTNITNYADAQYRYSATGHFEHGVSVYRFDAVAANLNARSYRVGLDSVVQQEPNLACDYAPIVPLTNNRFMYNPANSGSAWADLGYLALFDYQVPDVVAVIVNSSSRHIITDLLSEVDVGLKHQLWGINEWGYISKTTYNPLYTTAGYSYVSGVIDPLSNRQNAFPQSIYLPTTSAYVGSSTGDDAYDLSGDMTFNHFIWNRNETTRYLMSLEDSGTLYKVWMNSRNGQFSYGDVEVTFDDGVAAQLFGTISQKMKNDGFHMLTIVRRGLIGEIWIDAIKDTAASLPSAPSYPTSNMCIQLYGGPLYVNEWSVWNRALKPESIEFMYGGFTDKISGICTMDGEPLPSVLIAADVQTGKPLKTYTTKSNGRFNITLPRTIDSHQLNLIALPQDDTKTNNVVIHGPYNIATTYAKFNQEGLDRSLDDMILDMEPYAYYKLDESEGTVATDSSGNGRHGTIAGGVTLGVSAPVSELGAMDFDGVDGHIVLPAGYTDLTGGFTAEWWSNIDTSTGNWARIFELCSGTSGQNSVFVGKALTGTNLFFIAKDATGNGDMGVVNYNSAFTLGSWKHFAVRLTANGDYAVFMNGVKVAEATGQALPNVVERITNYIGRSTYTLDGYIDGKMSSFATYDHPLSDEDIKKHYDRALGVATYTLKGMIQLDEPDVYWTFDRGDQFADVIDGINLTKNGTFAITKNALAINAGTVGNNWLSQSSYKVAAGDAGWSLVCGFKTSTTHTDAVLVGEWNTFSDTGTYKVVMDSSNKIKVFFGDGATYIESTTSYNDSVWHLIVLTVDVDGVITLYIDGVAEATSDQIAIGYGTFDMSIGNASDGDASSATEGAVYVDDLAIFPLAIPATRIAEYNTQFVKKKQYQ